MSPDRSDLQRLALTIRILSAEGVEKANSGHPGMPMGAADYAALLWAEELRFNPEDPDWINRDRFVLSAGHGSMLLYSLLHLFQYDLPIEELQQFRQWGSKTPGHPEFGVTPGVETTTGPLGQGFANGVGLALSAKLMAAEYGEDIFDYRVFGIVSDGDLMEGVASEAASVAGQLGLGNLIYFYDDNEISIGGNTNVCFTESVPKRFEAYDWFVQEVDGHNLTEIRSALGRARDEKKRPSLIVCHTTIGFGSPKKAGSADVHGSPLGKEELAATKKALGWTETEAFAIPADVRAFTTACVEKKITDFKAWNDRFQSWSKADGARAEKLNRQLTREVPGDLRDELLKVLNDGKKDATRNISGRALQVIAKHLPFVVGGSADLEPSTKTLIKDSADIGPNSFSGRNLRFGVREHAMGAIANGLAYTQAWIPYTATFLVFSDYMRPPIRLAALSHLQSLFIFTHDSFWVGEDGPTHEPIEQIACLRAIPNLSVYRPADGIEVALAYYDALRARSHPSALLFTRQNLPPIERENFEPESVLRGGYIVSGAAEEELVLIATGSELAAVCEAAKVLKTRGTPARVVSLPCVERFMEQPVSYREAVIPPQARKVSVEAGSTLGWERIVGSGGLTIGIDHYGASAPGELLAGKFGFTTERILERVSTWLA